MAGSTPFQFIIVLLLLRYVADPVVLPIVWQGRPEFRREQERPAAEQNPGSTQKGIGLRDHKLVPGKAPCHSASAAWRSAMKCVDEGANTERLRNGRLWFQAKAGSAVPNAGRTCDRAALQSRAPFSACRIMFLLRLLVWRRPSLRSGPR